MLKLEVTMHIVGAGRGNSKCKPSHVPDMLEELQGHCRGIKLAEERRIRNEVRNASRVEFCKTL